MFEPMLLSSDDPKNVNAYIDDDAWIFQQKLDGIRCAFLNEPSPRLVTRGGRPLRNTTVAPFLSGIGQMCVQLFKDYPGIILDMEIMGGVSIGVFDMPQNPYIGITFDTPFHKRWEKFLELRDNFRTSVEHLDFLPEPVATAHSAMEKGALFNRVKILGDEGVVAKRRDGKYIPGKRSKDVIKLKLTNTADVVVIDINRGASNKSIRGGDKQNYVLGLYRGKDLVEVGVCSAIGRARVNVGDVVEVEYLYVGAGGRLVQPRMVKTRPDRKANECLFDQLRFVSKTFIRD